MGYLLNIVLTLGMSDHNWTLISHFKHAINSKILIYEFCKTEIITSVKFQ